MSHEMSISDVAFVHDEDIDPKRKIDGQELAGEMTRSALLAMDALKRRNRRI